jgi:hypothetical protein
MVAPNLLGPVLSFGGDIKNASSADYLVANGRGDGASVSAIQPWVGHVSPCSGSLAISWSKTSPDTHSFTISLLDPATLGVLAVRNVTLSGSGGFIQLTTAIIPTGDLITLEHNPIPAPISAPGETVINVYLGPLGNAAVSSDGDGFTVVGPKKTRQDEWEVV